MKGGFLENKPDIFSNALLPNDLFEDAVHDLKQMIENPDQDSDVVEIGQQKSNLRLDGAQAHEAALKASFERAKTYVPPEKTKGGIRKAGFEPAWHVSEADGKKRTA